MTQLYICFGSILLGNLRSFVFAGASLKYFGAVEAARLPSAPLDQEAAPPSSSPAGLKDQLPDFGQPISQIHPGQI